MVGLVDLADRMPDTLSGGQKQRVALARAIAPRPAVLLLDEPFSNLDTTLRVGVRTEVHRLLVELGITSVFVTHDQDEAFVLGNRVAVMSDGHITQVGTPAQIYRSPSSRWIAEFVGEVNVLAGQAGGDQAETALGALPLRDPAAGAVDVVVRPEDLRLEPGSGGAVTLIEFYGHDMLVSVRLDSGADVVVRAPTRPEYQLGDVVSVRFTGEPAVAFVV
jgi:iron(III) transport system ATP-binding protein